MRICWIFLAFFIPVGLSAQKYSLSLTDSLRLDSLTKELIRTGRLDMEHLSELEVDKVLDMRNWMGLRQGKAKVEQQAQLFHRLETERNALRDSVIHSISEVKIAAVQTRWAEILLQIGDSTSIRFLVSHLDLAFNPGAWHSDIWGQYPIAQLVCKAAMQNLSFFPYAREVLLKTELEDPVDYIYAELLGNIFRGNEEVMYIFLNKLLQDYPNNEALINNVASIKNTLKNY